MVDIKKKFGMQVRRLRKDLGLSQEELASQANLDRTFISHIERGTRSITIESIEKVSRALNVDIQELFDFSDLDSSG